MENMVNQKLDGKKILLTGHTGFKGSWLAILLQELGANVYGLSDDFDSYKLWNNLNLQNLTNIKCDIRDLDQITEHLKVIRPDAVIHMAAQSLVATSFHDPLDTISKNVTGTVNILEACRSINPHSILIVTSDKVYENNGNGEVFVEKSKFGGKDIYSASKACCELLAKAYYENFFHGTNTSVHTVRSGNVIGGGDFAKNRIVPDIIRAIETKDKLVLRNPQSTRPWQHVLEPLSGYLNVLEYSLQKPSYDCWNFGPNSGENKSVQDLVNEIMNFVQLDYEVQNFHEFKEAKLLNLCSRKANLAFGWKNKYNFEETINKTISWYLKFIRGENPIDLCRSDIYEYYNR